LVLVAQTRGVSRQKTLTPLNDSAFWIGSHARNYPKSIIELYFGILIPRDFSNSVHFRRPPRTNHTRELSYWRQQLFIEVPAETIDRKASKTRFDDPNYWISQTGFRNMGKNSNTFIRTLRA